MAADFRDALIKLDGELGALGMSPVLLRQLFTTEVRADHLRPFGRTLGRVVFATQQP